MISLSARETAQRIRSGKLSVASLLKSHLKEISDQNKKINALCYINEKESTSLAKKLDQEAKRGNYRGRLHGLPFTVKDHIDVKGLPRSDGNKSGYEKKADKNAAIVQRLLNEGAFVIGKANMAEYGKSRSFTESSLYGRSSNPINQSYAPGGSGGGDAAAIAAGFAQFALGADAGGSVRIPANFCGLFGLHSSIGTISNAGLTLHPHTTSGLFRSHGFFAKRLEDVELIFSILAGFDSSDPYSVEFPIANWRPKKRIAYFSTMLATPCDKEILSTLNQTVNKFKAIGYETEELTPPAFEKSLEPFIILAGQAALLVEDKINVILGRARNQETETEIVKSLRQRIATELPPLSAERLLLCWYQVDRLRLEMVEFFTKFDFIIAPVAASSAPLHGATTFKINGKECGSEQVYHFASAANVLALPALAFPTGTAKNGLPLGLQIIGPRFSDRELIRALATVGVI